MAVNQTKREKVKIAQTSAFPLTSSEAAWRSEKATRQSTKRGEQIAIIAQTSTVALTSSEAAWQSSKIAWQSIEGKEKPARIVRTQKQIATSSTKASRRDINAILIGQPDPKVREQTAENQSLSRSSPPIVAPAPQDDSLQPIPPARTLNGLVVTIPTAEDSKSFRYFSHVDIPVKFQNARVQHPTVIPSPRRKCAPVEIPVNRRNVRAKHQTVMPPLLRNCAIPATEGKSDVSSYSDIPQTCFAARVRPQTLRLICKRRRMMATNQQQLKEDSLAPLSKANHRFLLLTARSKRYPPKILLVSTIHIRPMGGWRVLNAGNAAIEI